MTWQELRDRVLLGLGSIGLVTLLVVWVITGRSPDPQLLIVFSGMAGLPSVLPRRAGP